MHRRKLPKTSKFKTNKNLTTFLKCLRLISVLSFVISRAFTAKSSRFANLVANGRSNFQLDFVVIDRFRRNLRDLSN